MKLLPFLYFMVLFLAREATAYDPKQLVRGYLVISNPTAAKILINQCDPLMGRRLNEKRNRNKMSLLGLGLYILCALTFLLHAVLLLMKPMGTADYTIDTGDVVLHTDSLNEAIIIVSTLILFLVNGVSLFMNSLALAIRRPKVSGRKLTIGIYMVLIILVLIFIAIELAELFHLIGQI